MLGVSLSAVRTQPHQWWPQDAVYAADFVSNRYMRAGVEIPAGTAFSLTRASGKLAEDIAGNWTSFGPNEPARTNKGLLIEPEVTNMVPNATMTGATVGVLGSGGSLPDGWSVVEFSSVEICDTGTEGGLPFVELRLQYTNGTGTNKFPRIEVAGGVPAMAGENWTASGFYRLISGAWHANTSAFMNVQEIGDTTIYPTVSRPDDMTTRTRLQLNWTTTRTGPISLHMRLLMFTVAPGESVDVTTRFYAPMLAKEAAASSPVLTDGSGPATRAADAALLHLPTGTHDLAVYYEDGATSTTPGISGDFNLLASQGISVALVITT